MPPGHRELTLLTSDGIKLAATWVPPRNGAAVVLVHGSGGDRGGGILSRARMLARHGYGVLLYDARGSGESAGRPENLGWTWPRDVKAALDYVAKQPAVTKGIGALGLSTGAEVLLTSAAQDKRIKAVVAEGTQARTLKELGLLPFGGQNLQGVHARPDGAVTRRPDPEDRTTAGVVDRRRQGLRAAEELPDTAHTGGLAKHPVEYERRVIGFFNRALLGHS